MIRVLLIRADAGIDFGTGHVMRCLALAQRWQAAGGRVRFVQAQSTPAIAARLQQECGDVLSISAERGSLDDARQTAAEARASGAEWIVADGYCFGADWQREVRAAGVKLLVIDDEGRAGGWAADVLLNQNLSANAADYSTRSADTRLLLGTRFVLLRREFLQAGARERATSETARRILVTLGGSDAANVTAKVMAALEAVPGLEIVVVAGGSNPHVPALKTQLAQSGLCGRLEIAPSNLPELMAGADLAISAAGSTAWELAFLGVPTLLLSVAPNQVPIASALAARGVCVDLGAGQGLESARLATEVKNLVADPERRRRMSERGRELVDGHGAARVAAALGAPLRVTLVTDATTWFNAFVPELKTELETLGHVVTWIHEPADLLEGDIALLLSLGRIVPPEALRRHAHNLVVHGSAVPAGRGWSPITWQVLEGKNEIPMTLLEAAAGVDSGDIHLQSTIRLRGDELVDELRQAQAASTHELCRRFIAAYPFNLADARAQSGKPSYYPRRRAVDSRLDLDKPLREQFHLLRVCDPDRYPAYFELAGRRFEVRVSVASEPKR